ncbi:UDP-N-acetylmuramate--L-alanine ligase [Candidatus Parcubacteria bacterium]|nr:MAG: UDP-N-acetylmuramate--L-alanine ligase [Candidatus Parcubacteria bacterium]
MKIHFIGIGGIGMSALAQYFVHQGYQVSGSDATFSEVLERLRKMGVKIFLGHKAKNISLKTKLIIYSAAIGSSNPELKRAKDSKIIIKTYAQALGELTKKYFTIAVSGSHGKSTTTAMVALILVKAGFDPTVIVGTKLREFGNNNFRLGKSKYLVVEADEYARAFHNYFSNIAVVTNIDSEHLDIYKNINWVISAFKKFLLNVSPDGKIIANGKDKNVLKALVGLKRKLIFFGTSSGGKYPLKILGLHNQLNAEAASKAALYLGISKELIRASLQEYNGAWRRMELVKPRHKALKKFLIFSDYAHHPTEIAATLQGLRERYPGQKLICVFQPHQQDRLTRLFKEYPASFIEADELILLPEYIVLGRDKLLKHNKTSKELAVAVRKIISKKSRLKKIFYFKKFEQVLKHIKNSGYPQKTTFVFMGAGSLDNEVKNKL